MDCILLEYVACPCISKEKLSLEDYILAQQDEFWICLRRRVEDTSMEDYSFYGTRIDLASKLQKQPDHHYTCPDFSEDSES